MERQVLGEKTRAQRDGWPDLSDALAGQLLSGCETLDLAIDSSQQVMLIEYLELMVKWNKTYNLTAVREPAEMVIRHLLDSLAIAAHLEGKRFLDVGTGAGLPGVPLAILFPQRQFHLLDSNGKKTRFLFQVKTALGLDNMTAHQARVESFSAHELFDGVLSRAFASLQDMVSRSRHLLAPAGSFYAMKGAFPGNEVEALKEAGWEIGAESLVVPGLDEARHLVTIRPAASQSGDTSTSANTNQYRQ